MPYHFDTWRKTIDTTYAAVEKAIFTRLCDLAITLYHTKEPVPFLRRMEGEACCPKREERWGELFDCGWFHFEGTIPSEAAGKAVSLYIDVGGELLVYDENGIPVRGLTNVNTLYYPEDKAGKCELPITDCAAGGEPIDIWADAGCNDLAGMDTDNGTLHEASICVMNPQMKGLFYDMEVLRDLLVCLHPDSAAYHQVLYALHQAALKMQDYTEEEALSARAILAPQLAKRGGDPSLTVTAIGHAHIDLAWTWPLRETYRKGARTFATALRNMETYPAYRFGASQMQLYAWIKRDHPALYEQIKRRVAEGRWEVQGGMWVEADTNCSGGEALIRQFLYGKRFAKEEFGLDMRMLWLPDVFGYTASLPQILKKCGVDYFMTIKLSWSKVDVYPHHTFLWRGIDGTEVLAHMPPENNYVSAALPNSLRDAERQYCDKCVSDECLLPFGIGDGGGGPGEPHLERLERLGDMQGLPRVRQGFAVDFFDRLNEGRDRYQTWEGELYLEFHQGTYTTQARSKQYNRRMEQALREWEFAMVLSGADAEATRAERDAIWQEMLLYQFHDILPGSSIKRVYDESLARYADLLAQVEAHTAACYAALGKRFSGGADTLLAVNSLGWERTGYVPCQGGYKRVTLPALGCCVVDVSAPDMPSGVLVAQENLLENDLLRVELGPDGAISRMVDKRADREVLDGVGGRFAVYYDSGDAWDFSMDFRGRAPEYFALVSSEAAVCGVCASVTQTYRYGDSTLKVVLSLLEGDSMLTFAAEADWHEKARMLRVSYPSAVKAETATCNIQFGNLKRPTTANTSWEFAKHEVCAHHFVDLSEPGYGVALLSRDKYGFSVADSVLDMNLLRSTSYPDESADQGVHTFTWAVYPHAGSLEQSDVDRRGYEFNLPIQTAPCGGGTALSASLLAVDAPNVIVETVKPAEDGQGFVVRLYESRGMRTKATIRSRIPLSGMALSDMLEQEQETLDMCDNTALLTFAPFEIHTVRLFKK